MNNQDRQKAAIASIDIDWHWNACSKCVYLNPEKDMGRGAKGGCDKDITHENDHRIHEDFDFDNIAYCTMFEEGEWKSEEEILAEAAEKGIVFDHPNQGFLCEGIAPLLQEDYVRSQRGLPPKKGKLNASVRCSM